MDGKGFGGRSVRMDWLKRIPIIGSSYVGLTQARTERLLARLGTTLFLIAANFYLAYNGSWVAIWLVPFFGLDLLIIVLILFTRGTDSFGAQSGAQILSEGPDSADAATDLSKSATTPSGGESDDISSKLERLKQLGDLRDSGAISDDEFESMKNDLMN